MRRVDEGQAISTCRPAFRAWRASPEHRIALLSVRTNHAECARETGLMESEGSRVIWRGGDQGRLPLGSGIQEIPKG